MESIAVLGLDALPYKLLEQYRDKGIAPSIFNHKNIKNSFKIKAIPPVTPASWPSIMSGVNPGKHGIFSFTGFDKNKRKIFFYNALHLMHPRITEMIAYEGGKVLSINPIMDYPIFPHKNMIILSNLFFTPKPLSHPKGIHEKYFNTPVPLPTEVNSYINYLNGLIGLLEDYLHKGINLFWINLNFPDAMYHTKPESLYNPELMSKVWFMIDKVYRLLKENLGNVIVVSDHGFSKFDKRININDILVKHGFAKVSKEGNIKLSHLADERIKIVKINKNIMKLLINSGIKDKIVSPFIRKIVKPLYFKLTGKKLVFSTGVSVSLSESKAFYPIYSTYGVYVTDSLITNKVIEILKKYEGFKIISKKEEIYSGNYLNRAPDIVVIPDHDKGYVLGPPEVWGSIYTHTITFEHDMWGVFMLDLEPYLMEKIDIEYIKSFDCINNNVIGPIIQCLLDYPLSHETDDRNFILGACRRKVMYKNYKGKFLVSKKIALMR